MRNQALNNDSTCDYPISNYYKQYNKVLFLGQINFKLFYTIYFQFLSFPRKQFNPPMTLQGK